MKVIHVPYSFPPDPSGGTEVYVRNLARLLQAAGVDTLVCAPGQTPTTYTYADLRVRRWCGAGVVEDASYAYDEGDRVGASEFEKIVDEESPDVVHFHSFTAMASLRLARRLRERGQPIVFTYHVPTVSCQRGSMLAWGREACDGKLVAVRCSACSLHGKGLPEPVARALAHVPAAVSDALHGAGLSGGVWTALRMKRLVETRHANIRAFLQIADRVVAPSQWVKQVLVVNGVAGDKIVMSPQGLPDSEYDVAHPATPASESGLRMAFLGRLDRTKGVDTVLRALSLIPEADVRFDVYGMVSRPNDPYTVELASSIRKDVRVRLMPAVPSSASISVMRGYDVLVVPSQWLETGPLVALEAFAAGIPVLGSNLGGITDRVRHGVDGLLVDAHDVAGWADAIGRLASDRSLLAALKQGIRPPPTMGDVSALMIEVYRDILRAHPRGSSMVGRKISLPSS